LVENDVQVQGKEWCVSWSLMLVRERENGPPSSRKSTRKKKQNRLKKTCVYHKGEEGVVFHLLNDIVLAL